MIQERSVELVGTSPAMIELRAEIDRVARSDARVLITGESGSGKELVANAVHARSRRAARAFVGMNCGGLSEHLLESELFGHVKGSFTGAHRDKAGTLELADKGTVFLDEVGEMTMRMQGMLLRFTETGELQKVGSDTPTAFVDVRIIAATNRDLLQMTARGQFRGDLYYRLNVLHLAVPSLRERLSDVPLLIEHFLGRLRLASHVVLRSVSDDAMAQLMAYPWPGNVRELENAIERLAVHCRHAVATVEDLPIGFRIEPHITFRPLRERRRTVSDELYQQMVEQQQSFWTTVYPLYMQRDITKTHVRDVVRRGLEAARGNYKIVAKLFNMHPEDYRRFLNFLRKHDCQLPFQDYRQ